MLSCREVTRLTSEAQDRPLTFAERLSLWRHTLGCSACRNFRRQMDFLRRAARLYRSGEHPGTED